MSRSQTGTQPFAANVIGLCVLLTVLTTPAMAAPIYDSFAKVESNAGSDLDSGAQSAFATHKGGTASAKLAPGGMYLSTSNPSATNGSASGTVTVADVVFSKKPGFETHPDTFDGELKAVLNTDAIPGNMSVGITVSDPIGGTGGGGNSTTNPAVTLFSIPLTDLEVGVPHKIEISASVRTTTGSPRDASLSVVLGSTVFDLPEGYTADSIDAQLEDNVYQGEVPEPTSMAVLVAGALGLLRRREP